ncbi:flavohemoglobin expression-modulating QEGLA motif protein [Salinimicrobium sp. GXAS 041]|uniref:flavohemoglobin expression-modulating QEGLA motif protein n=1 Tax=Salinimicrobium sp. GXAS 041 TaxID=3400806 RepID=UPI003C7819C8
MEVSTTDDLAPLSDVSISNMIQELGEEGQLDRHLPGGGYLHMSEELPYIVVYRLQEENKDKATIRLILSEASFLIIGNKDFEGYQHLLFQLSEAMSTKFKNCLVLEVFSGETGCNKFTIKGPGTKVPATLNMFKKQLDQLNASYEMLPLEETNIHDTTRRHREGEPALLTVEQLKRAGCLLLGLEVPPVYRSAEGEEYPVFFRSFRDNFIEALHQTVFEFIRVQTSSGVVSSAALGQKHLKDKVFEIDKKLSQIERSYQFLWLVSPSNIHEIKSTFFDSKYEKLLNYHYRLLPIDPDVLKRELYNLRIDEIDDPAMSFLFREKREELDQQITMLNERGTRKFFYNSILLYKGIDRLLCTEAEKLLEEVPETVPKENEELIDSREFSSLARREFDYFRKQDENFKGKVHIRRDVNIMMVSHGELYVPADYKMNRVEANALIQHEVGTHVLTYYNGLRQPLEQLSIGLADYDSLQEGLAVMAEYLVDGLTANRLRTLAGRVVAGKALIDGGDFREIFRLLKIDHGFSGERAFNITSRIMQGGGFLKDIIYLKGLVELREHLKKGGSYEPLLAGKFGLKHNGIIKALTEREILKPATLTPSYLLTENVQEKLQAIRKGLPLSKMIS